MSLLYLSVFISVCFIKPVDGNEERRRGHSEYQHQEAIVDSQDNRYSLPEDMYEAIVDIQEELYGEMSIDDVMGENAEALALFASLVKPSSFNISA